MDPVAHNRKAWDRMVAGGNRWTVPVTSDVVAQARAGRWHLILTPTRPVPEAWLGDVSGRRVLCLAAGGGQQGPLLAAAGAVVTVFDNSTAQLDRDRMVAERDGLRIETVQGDMADLSGLPDATFDLIVHPVSNCFVPDVRPVWRESFRVLAPGGALLSGFTNPVLFSLDPILMEEGILRLKYRIPYSDLHSLSEMEVRKRVDAGETMEWGHSLADQIGGQIDAGFVIAGFYEDTWGPAESGAEDELLPYFIATRALKL